MIVGLEEFIDAFSEHTGVTKKDSKLFFKLFDSFLAHCIENQIEFKMNLFELWFSDIKERETVKVGTNERVVLPKTRRANLRLANKYRSSQRIQNKVFSSIIVDKEED